MSVGLCPTHGGVSSANASSGEDFRGSSTARRGDGLGTAAHPGTQASGGARPTGGVSSANASSSEDFRGSSTARRGDGLGTAAHPGTQASGRARPTGGVFSANASSGEDSRGSSTARRGVGLGTAAHPGTRASGSARPTVIPARFALLALPHFILDCRRNGSPATTNFPCPRWWIVRGSLHVGSTHAATTSSTKKLYRFFMRVSATRHSRFA